MSVEDRSFKAEPRCVDLADAEQVRELTERFHVTESDIAAAVEKVGPNRTAVELWLDAPAA
jgi:hypothetical protein